MSSAFTCECEELDTLHIWKAFSFAISKHKVICMCFVLVLTIFFKEKLNVMSVYSYWPDSRKDLSVFSICVLVFYLVIWVLFCLFSFVAVSGSLFAFLTEFQNLEPVFLPVGHVAGVEVGGWLLCYPDLWAVPQLRWYQPLWVQTGQYPGWGSCSWFCCLTIYPEVEE